MVINQILSLRDYRLTTQGVVVCTPINHKSTTNLKFPIDFYDHPCYTVRIHVGVRAPRLWWDRRGVTLLLFASVAAQAEAAVTKFAKIFSVRGIPNLDQDSLTSYGHEVLWDAFLTSRQQGHDAETFLTSLQWLLRRRLFAARRNERHYIEHVRLCDLQELFDDPRMVYCDVDEIVEAEAFDEFLTLLSPDAVKLLNVALSFPQEATQERMSQSLGVCRRVVCKLLAEVREAGRKYPEALNYYLRLALRGAA